tara:strand:- start:11744 stop:12421 length:678 start_codon:yes stop_codon:yes gene_type:complete
VKPLIILDFDSTIIKDETLDKIALYKSNISDKKKQEIINITNLAMEGKIEFSEALKKRINLLSINKSDIIKVSELLKYRLSDSFNKQTNYIRSNLDTIYIISGGFKEIIYNVVKDIGIKENHIYANEFLYDSYKKVIGVVKTNCMSCENGKIKALENLDLKNGAYIIGDGYTDYQMRQVKGVKAFICFTENITRSNVCEKADFVAPSFKSAFDFIYKSESKNSIN